MSSSNKWLNQETIENTLNDHQWICDALTAKHFIPLSDIIQRWQNVLSKRQSAKKIAIHCLKHNRPVSIKIRQLDASWIKEPYKSLILWSYTQKTKLPFQLPESLKEPKKPDRHLACITLWATCQWLKNKSLNKDAIVKLINWTEPYPETQGFLALIYAERSKNTEKVLKYFNTWQHYPFNNHWLVFLLERFLNNPITKKKSKQALLTAMYTYSDHVDVFQELLSLAYQYHCYDILIQGLMLSKQLHLEINRAYDIVARIKTGRLSSAFYLYQTKGHPKTIPDDFVDILLQSAFNMGNVSICKQILSHLDPNKEYEPWIELSQKDYLNQDTVEEWFHYVNIQKTPKMRYLWGAIESLLKCLPSQYMDISDELILICDKLSRNKPFQRIAIAMKTRLLYHQRRFADCCDTFELLLNDHQFFNAIKNEASDTLAKSARDYCESLIYQNEWIKFNSFWQELKRNSDLDYLKKICPFHVFIFFKQLEKNVHFPKAQQADLWREWMLRWEIMLRLPLDISQLGILTQRFIAIKKEIQDCFQKIEFEILAMIDDIGLQIERHIKAVAQTIIDQKSIAKSFEERLTQSNLNELTGLIHKFEAYKENYHV